VVTLYAIRLNTGQFYVLPTERSPIPTTTYNRDEMCLLRGMRRTFYVQFRLMFVFKGLAMAQAVSHQPLSAETWVLPRLVLVRFVVDRVAPRQVLLRVLRFFRHHSTDAPYSFILSFIHLPPTLYNVFLPALQFPLSVPFHHCSILIHPSTTHAV